MHPSLTERVAGAAAGALIGDALGLGTHWYYDLDALRRDHGPWVTGYTEPKPGRYHAGMKAGELSQTGLVTLELLRSLTARGEYDQKDFTARLDAKFLARMDGTPYSGPGGYTNQGFRDAHQARVAEGKPWGQTGGYADTTEAAERAALIALRYALSPMQGALMARENILLTHVDPFVAALSLSFDIVAAAIARGEPLDGELGGKLYGMVERRELPYTHVVLAEKTGAYPATPLPTSAALTAPDGLLFPSHIWRAAQDPDVRIEPAWKASLVYGLPCSIICQLPAAYYLAARFEDDFESAVLHAINGGGQNMSRAMLAGILVGARCGISGIPKRLLEGLADAEEVLDLALLLGRQAMQV
ncbi:MAG: ADP-ribosylglycohydrolase [Deltaproteobacteria bacterium HGW-Deltaproteobacteria-8]|jgi:ADP-ribosylglycohydrolase|nr:MAG: ADP-ribosylglycohydrolase [Deltaproteobacteria bacterium HGW-Deltaproteobacteria-8]